MHAVEQEICICSAKGAKQSRTPAAAQIMQIGVDLHADTLYIEEQMRQWKCDWSLLWTCLMALGFFLTQTYSLQMGSPDLRIHV